MENITLNIVSDLHLDIDGVLPNLPGGDVLVIAGDICEARSLRFHENLTKEERRIRTAIQDFLVDTSKKYNKIFTVLGNHEHYHSKYQQTRDAVLAGMPDNFSVLENQCEEYNGVLFIGATLWTDLNKHDHLTQLTVKDFMNDYRCITYVQGNEYRKLRPADTTREFARSVGYIKAVLENPHNLDKKVVVVTHHAPTYMSIAEQYRNDQIMNGAYASDLSELILDNPQIALWTCGHTHTAHWYYVGDTLIACNPFGYQQNGFKEYSGFNPNFTIDLSNMPDKDIVSVNQWNIS